MIELLFSESAAASLACTKEGGNGNAGETVKLVTDKVGNISSNSRESMPYSCHTIEGLPSDLVPLWLMADIGDISDLPDSHISLLRKIKENYAGQDNWTVEDIWAEKETKHINALIDRFRKAAQTEEPIRIYY
jgi:hypothetical protein